MTDELKPCPFCGSEVERVPPYSDMSEYIRHTEHGQCPVEFTAFTLAGGDEMLAAWNTRAEADTLASQARQIEALRDCLKDCADDLEAEVQARYPAEISEVYPIIQRRYARDMESVKAARATLEETSRG